MNLKVYIPPLVTIAVSLAMLLLNNYFLIVIAYVIGAVLGLGLIISSIWSGRKAIYWGFIGMLPLITLIAYMLVMNITHLGMSE
jgi:hypothetical protein